MEFWLRYRHKTQRMESSIAPLLIKFLNNEADREELMLLEKWIAEEGSSQLLSDYLKINAVAHELFSQYDGVHAKEIIRRRIEEDKRRIRIGRRNSYLKYAAILVLSLGLGYFIFQQTYPDYMEVTAPIIVNNQIQTGSDRATLTLGDGSQVALSEGEQYQSGNATSNGEKIDYEATEVQEVQYNTLTIPRGGQFVVELSDGTMVWLNSASQLKYPVSFSKGKDRSVELVYGEAYFDVSPSTKHQGARFFVAHAQQKVEVLGTEFNIKAYPEEEQVLTTLVEGQVSLDAGLGQKSMLTPGQQAIWDKASQGITIANVDVYDQVSWKDGVFSFDRMALEDIMTVLSRWYDMDVEFESPELRDEGFTGVLGKEQEIEEILTTIKNFKVIENYEINKKTITLK